MRLLLAALFLVHGIAHLPGFIVDWQLRSFPELPFRTRILAGTVDIGPMGIKAVGIGWLFVGVAFVALALAVVMHASWWQAAAYLTVLLSVMLCIAGWPDSRFGLVANAVIATLMLLAFRWTWAAE